MLLLLVVCVPPLLPKLHLCLLSSQPMCQGGGNKAGAHWLTCWVGPASVPGLEMEGAWVDGLLLLLLWGGGAEETFRDFAGK